MQANLKIFLILKKEREDNSILSMFKLRPNISRKILKISASLFFFRKLWNFSSNTIEQVLKKCGI